MQEDDQQNLDEFSDLSVPNVSEDSDRVFMALADNIARLEEDLDSEREERLEERFIWFSIVAMLVDIIALTALERSWLFLPIFMLQLIIMFGFAKKCGVDWAVSLIAWLLHMVSRDNRNRS